MGFKWLKHTDLSGVVSIAKNLLYVEIRPLMCGLCCHPFTNTTVVFNENKEFVDLTKDIGAYHKWLKDWEERLDEAEDIWSILAYLNNAYNMCFLKYAKDYMSLEDFSECLSECWIT